jgi:hypothetical protein
MVTKWSATECGESSLVTSYRHICTSFTHKEFASSWNGRGGLVAHDPHIDPPCIQFKFLAVLSHLLVMVRTTSSQI